MSIFRRIADFLRGEQPPSTPTDTPKLRNKPGGMAWIRCTEGCGTEQLHGRFVTTVRAGTDGFWTVEPELQFRATWWLEGANGRSVNPGELVTIKRIHDSALEPVPDTGLTREEVDQLYAPGPVLIPLRVKGEVH